MSPVDTVTVTVTVTVTGPRGTESTDTRHRDALTGVNNILSFSYAYT